VRRETAAPRWFTPEALAVNGWPVRYARDQVVRADPDTWAASRRALAGVDTLRRLPELRMPTRLSTGDLPGVSAAADSQAQHRHPA
jgi:3-oxoadipate enol-lactonase